MLTPKPQITPADELATPQEVQFDPELFVAQGNEIFAELRQAYTEDKLTGLNLSEIAESFQLYGRASSLVRESFPETPILSNDMAGIRHFKTPDYTSVRNALQHKNVEVGVIEGAFTPLISSPAHDAYLERAFAQYKGMHQIGCTGIRPDETVESAVEEALDLHLPDASDNKELEFRKSILKLPSSLVHTYQEVFDEDPAKVVFFVEAPWGTLVRENHMPENDGGEHHGTHLKRVLGVPYGYQTLHSIRKTGVDFFAIEYSDTRERVHELSRMEKALASTVVENDLLNYRELFLKFMQAVHKHHLCNFTPSFIEAPGVFQSPPGSEVVFSANDLSNENVLALHREPIDRSTWRIVMFADTDNEA